MGIISDYIRMQEDSVVYTDPKLDELVAIGESIDYAFEQIATMLEIRDSTSKYEKLSKEAVRIVAIVNESIAADQSLFSSAVLEGIALESIDELEFKRVLAMEAEDGKSLIGQLIDNVVKAFQWLWDRVTSIFRAKPVEIDDDMPTKVEDAFKSAGTLTENIVLDKDKIPAGLAYLGKSIALKDVADVLKLHGQHVSEMRGFMDALLKGSEPLNSYVAQLSSNKEMGDVVEKLKQFGTDFPATFKNFMKLSPSAELFNDYGVKTSGQVDMKLSYAYGPVVTKTGPAIFAYVTQTGSKGNYSFTSSISKKKVEAGDDFKLDMGKEAGPVIEYSKNLLEYSKKLTAEWDDVQAQMGRFERSIKGSGEALTKLKNELGKDVPPEKVRAIKDFIALVNGVGKVQTGLFGTLSALKESLTVFEKVVDATITSIKGRGKSQDNKEAKPEETKPEEKPPEGQPKT